MIVVMKQQATQAQMDAAIQIMKEGGVKVMVSRGTEATVLGAEGNAKNRPGTAFPAPRRGAGDAGQRAV